MNISTIVSNVVTKVNSHTTQLDTARSAMTKAQFNALAEERKANRAGSGFDELGLGTNAGGATLIQDGMFVVNSYNNFFKIGGGTVGTSRSPYAISNINGVTQKLKEVASSNTNQVAIFIPTAPNIYPYDTVLTAEQIASGVIKHADASNSGLIVNGKFVADLSGWTTTGTNWSWDNGTAKLNLTSNADLLSQNLSTIKGKKYILELDIIEITGNIKIMNTSLTQLYLINRTGKHIIEIIADSNLTSVVFSRYQTGVNSSCAIDSFAVYPSDAISRSDLALLESWHEDVSEKGFVYPLGNTQYLGGNTDGLTGIIAGSFSGANTYSLFGNWQAPSALIGKGYVWSNLTEVQKRAFIANPENNCYLDGDKTIQVRYRVRVLMGEDTNSMAKATVHGKAVVPSAVLFTAPTTTVDAGLYSNTSATYTYTGTTTGAISIATVSRRNQGMYHPVYNANGSKKASDGNFWYNTAVSFTSISDCFDPAKLLTASGYIGTVSGRPDGLFYDQVHESDIIDLRNSSKKVEDYNRLITREFNKLVAGTYRGNESEKLFKPITFTNCGFVQYGSPNGTRQAYTIYNNSSFIPKWNAYWGIGITGWAPTLFGNNIPKTPFALILAKKAGTNYFIEVLPSIANDLVVFRTLDGTPTLPNVGSLVELVFDEITWLWLPSAYEYMGTSYGHKNSVISTRTKSNTLLHCDIIGNPTNYPTAWKQSGVFGTPLILAEDGTSLLPDGTLDSFKLSRKANAIPLLCLRSTDNGATWTSFTPTFSTTTNAITLTDEPAANLVMVYYQTHTNMATTIVNGEVIESGKVLGTDGIANSYLISTLIGKVPTANTAPYLQDGYNINAYRIDSSTLKFSTTAIELPTHTALSLAGGASGVPAVKVFPYLTRANGKAYLNLVFKEMKHNGTSWGDDNKFNIVDNVSTTTDNNAATVLIGQKMVELPYFIGADE